MSAAGSFMPPMLIFPRKKKKQEYELGLPPGGWSETHSSGWMTTELFIVWFKKFIDFSKATKESPVLLILDGHSTHTKNLHLIDMARENGVVLLCLPPHTSHRLQPLDVTFFKPLSLYYADEIRKWLRCNPAKVVTLFQVSSIFGAAFLHAATMTNAINGFRKTGIWPPDCNVFSDADFLPAASTDIQLDDSECPTTNPTSGPCDSSIKHPKSSPDDCLSTVTEPLTKKTKTNEDLNKESQPGCSFWVSNGHYPTPIPSAFETASPESVMPIPLIKQNAKRANRRKGKTAVLTGSPYKKELETTLKNKEEREKEKEKKRREREDKKKDKEEKIRKKLSDTKTNEKGAKNVKKTLKKKVKRKKNITTDSETDENDDAECLYCGDFYSTSDEGWVSCQSCLKWAHNSCSGIDSEDDEAVLVCEHCK